MARYLSAEWFAEAGASAQPDSNAELILEQNVEDTPEGDVTYRVEVQPSGSRLLWPVPEGAAPADLVMHCDWNTAVAIARGEVSAQSALMEGRIRVSGDTRRLARPTSDLAGLDPVPASVRQTTTYATD